VSSPPGDDEVAIDVEATRGGAGVGRVVETGARCAGLAGRRVVVGPSDACGECEVCRRGGAPVCPLARHRPALAVGRVVVAGRWVVPLDDGLELPLASAAAIAGDATLAYTLYARTGLAPREPAVVTGDGPIARYLVEILVAKGVAPTVVADPDDAVWCTWLAGAGATVTPASPSTPHAEVRATIAAAFAAQGLGVRPWRILAASPASIGLAAALAGPRATLTVLAPVASLPGQLVADEVTIIGVAGPHPDLVVEVAAMCKKGEIQL
jgi:D-arabinose 1-dehydrogenase-like Zn-dependent alcohol dehydrogenase